MVFIYASIIHECADDSNTIYDYFCKFSLNSDPVRDNIVNVVFSCRGGLPVILLVTRPQIQQKAKRHQPHLILRQMKVGKALTLPMPLDMGSVKNVYHTGFDKTLIICYDNGASRSHPRITVFSFLCCLYLSSYHPSIGNHCLIYFFTVIRAEYTYSYSSMSYFFLSFNLAGMAGS